VNVRGDRLNNAGVELVLIGAALGVGLRGAPFWWLAATIALTMLWWGWSRRRTLRALWTSSAFKMLGAGVVALALTLLVHGAVFALGLLGHNFLTGG
jgi:hypothetical protein